MANKLVTDIVINLAGNMAAKARQYGQSMSQFAAQSKNALAMMNSTMAATSQGIDTFGNRLVLAGAASAIAFERTFIKTAAEFERYQIMLNKLQGGPEGGAKAMSWVKQFAQDTPYAVNEVTQSFVRLKAFGLDPMDGTMQAIADQAAMMGGTAETMDGISLALGQAWTKGKLQGEEALQLLERGVPVWDYLQKASKELGKNNGLGYTTQQLQDMASKGQLTRKAIKDLIDQMGLASKGAAKTQMESWNGMISNMGDSWTMFKTDVMDSGAFTVLKQELGSLLKQLDEMKKTGEYDELVEKIGGNLVDAFKAAAEAIRDAKELGAELIPVLKSVGETANGIADMVGGYENLAKILGSIYLLNKGGRLLAPVAKGAITAGGWAAGAIFKKGKGGAAGIGDAMADLGATPVYVVNMPGSGMGGMSGGADISGGGGSGGKGGKFKRFAKAAPALAGGAAFTLLYAASESEEAKRLKAESDKAQQARATLPTAPMLSNKDAYALLANASQEKPVRDNPYAQMAKAMLVPVLDPAMPAPALAGGAAFTLLYAASESDKAQQARATLPTAPMLSNKDAYALLANASQEKPVRDNPYAQMAKAMLVPVLDPAMPAPGIDGRSVFASSLGSNDIVGGMANILSDFGSLLAPTPLKQQQFEGSLDIRVSDDRITVRTRDTAPGLQVRVDNGPSLMP